MIHKQKGTVQTRRMDLSCGRRTLASSARVCRMPDRLTRSCSAPCAITTASALRIMNRVLDKQWRTTPELYHLQASLTVHYGPHSLTPPPAIIYNKC